MNALFTFFEYLGVLVFALSGSIMAARKNMDFYGIIILAILTALGGGLIRDVMIGRIPPLMLSQGSYLAVAAAAAPIIFVFYRRLEKFHYPLRILDALGLGVFTVLGARTALAAGLPNYAAIMLGIISGTGGGMLRDVLAREVPLVLQREIYAAAALIGALGYVFLEPLAGDNELWQGVLAIGSAGFIAAFRIFSVYRDWHLPRAFSEPSR
jgi:uncharacterized membrane protein YeiH